LFLEVEGSLPSVRQLKEAIILFSALSFLVYGTGCFSSQNLRDEFVRYGFSRERRLIGFLQICGSLGLIAGMWLPWLGKGGAGGLAVMMLVAVLVRFRIRDSFLKTTPAIFYFFVNTYLALFAY
jgi:uncharacterized membrane protein YkgB